MDSLYGEYIDDQVDHCVSDHPRCAISTPWAHAYCALNCVISGLGTGAD